MYGIFTYIYHKNEPNVGKYTIHGSYGQCCPKTNYKVITPVTRFFKFFGNPKRIPYGIFTDPFLVDFW